MFTALVSFIPVENSTRQLEACPSGTLQMLSQNSPCEAGGVGRLPFDNYCNWGHLFPETAQSPHLNTKDRDDTFYCLLPCLNTELI